MPNAQVFIEGYSNASYLELFRLTGLRFTDYYDLVSSQPMSHAVSQLGPSFQVLLHHNPNYLRDLATAVSGAVLLTLIRAVLCNLVISMLLKYQLLERNRRSCSRFAESLYSLVFYATSFALAATIEGQNQYLSHPERLWTGFSLSDRVPNLVYFLYVLEVAHYLHCLYAVLYINAWSKDSSVLFFHHIVALLLISISYLTRTYRIGILVLYLHDVCDVIMESCKVVIKLQFKSNWALRVAECLRVGGFVSFVICWFVFRLYYFPLRVIYPSVLYLSSNPVHTWFPLSFLLYFLLWFIYTMNVYWASLIVKVLVNAIRGGHEEIEDIREQDEDEEEKEKPLKNGKSE